MRVPSSPAPFSSTADAVRMAAMSDSLGADTRLVTAMQYTRLLLILASLVAVASVLHHFDRCRPPHQPVCCLFFRQFIGKSAS